MKSADFENVPTMLLWPLLAVARSARHSPPMRFLLCLLALTFGPTVFLIGSGQITAVVLFGLAGFLHFARQGRPLPAGKAGRLAPAWPRLAEFTTMAASSAYEPSCASSVVSALGARSLARACALSFDRLTMTSIAPALARYRTAARAAPPAPIRTTRFPFRSLPTAA